jgi:uncharacterized protein (TIGR02147 family)
MKKSPSPVNLFEYLDYRKYLRDWYHAAKKTRASFSYRTFSKRAGFQSTNFLKLVMDGERNLTEQSLAKFMTGLRLNKQEQEFFTNLVFFNQATTYEVKDLYYQQLLRSRKYSQLRPIERDRYEYYSTWYHPVVRELVISKDFDGTPESIAKRIFPSILPSQVEKSIELLGKLGFIEKAQKGKWRQTSSLISTGPEVVSLAVVNYHKSVLEITKDVLNKVPAFERDVSTMTLGVVRGRMPELKKKVQEFRQEILKLVSMDTEPEEVVQLNIQLIPFTRTGEKNQGEDPHGTD